VFGGGAIVALLGLFNAIGCGASGASSDEPTRATDDAIQGGQSDSTHTFEMGVCALASGPGQCQLLCTGTLIAPNLVVTARHCVSQTPTDNVDCATTSFGGQYAASQFYVTTNASIDGGSGTWFRAKQIITPVPTPLCGNDIALIILQSNVPASAATPAIPNVMYDLRDRTHISTLADTAIGYGLTNPLNITSAGTRYIRQNIQFICIPDDPSRFVDCWAHGYQGLLAEQEFYSGDGLCRGDSGSAAFSQAQFDQGQFLALGVLSRGGVTANGATCTGSFYTRLDSYRDLIIATANTAASQGGYTPPSWVNSPPIAPLADAGGTPADGGGTPPTDDSGAPPPSTNQATSASSGCAIAPAKDPSKPIPWLIGIAGIALVGAALRRKRG
jgi:hypothetical protein